jgi:Flp pilus assembly protein CpaB
MRKRWPLLAGLLALLAAVAAGQYAYTQYNQIVSTAPVPVAAVPIPPYTLITADMLHSRNLPRPMLAEPIYTEASDLVGQMTTQALVAGQVIYRHQAVPPQAFRLASPDLEVISVPVATEQAVGGALRIGSRVNLYRIVTDLSLAQAGLSRGQGATAPGNASITMTQFSEVELLAEGAPVVDVRERTGVPATQDTAPSGNSRPGSASPSSSSDARQSQRVPIQIVTLAVRHDQAQEIVRLMGEAGTAVKFWFTLAPVVSPATSTDAPLTAPAPAATGEEAP